MFFCGGLVRLVAGRPCRCGIHRGAWRFWSPPYLPLALFLAPYPPDPLPQWGRGRFLLYFAGGFAPGTPALNRLRHLQNLPSRYPAGCLPSLPPAYPAFSLLYCPQPPDPLPGGKGETQSLFRRGLRPRHPGHLFALPLWCLMEELAPALHWLSLPRGRGPSQTPKFLSPGPPSPWLPALLIENRFLSFLRRTMGSAPGCPHGRGCKCRPDSAPGMQGAKPLA